MFPQPGGPVGSASRQAALRTFVLLAAVALLPATLAAQAPASALPAAVLEQIEGAISTEMARQGIPGLSAAVVVDDELQWADGRGFADLENFVPATSATVYRLASVSKPITAVAALRLVEQGKLDLDAPVQKYVPVFPPKPWPITPRHLLSHLGGIRHYRPGEFESTKHYEGLTSSLGIFMDDPLVHQPGTKYFYTTFGYNLLGSVVEGAAGQTYLSYLEENVFKPAGMDRTRSDEVGAIIPHRAQGYRKLTSGELRNSGLADASYKIPGGGLCSTVVDLGRFAIALLTGRLVTPGTREAMFTIRALFSTGAAGDESTARRGYGYGWYIAERGGIREVWHTGGQQRVSTVLLMVPSRRLAVAIMANLEGVSLLDLARRITGILMEERPSGQ